MTQFDLTNRAALVTGSTRGIGRGIADSLTEAGAEVVYNGRAAAPADLPEGALYVPCDMSDLDAALQMVDGSFAARPNLDILVCNAGSFFDTPFLEMTTERWDQTLDLNVRTPYFLIQRFARKLIVENRTGSIIVISSTNGFQAEYDSTAYDTSKGALVMLTRTLALGLADYGIRVNSVAPGLIHTPLTAWLNTDTGAATAAHYEKNIPLHRIGLPNDCGGATAFLASDAAAYITGQILIVDGGLTLAQIGKM